MCCEFGKCSELKLCSPRLLNLCTDINKITDCPIPIFAEEVLHVINCCLVKFVRADHLKNLL